MKKLIIVGLFSLLLIGRSYCDDFPYEVSNPTSYEDFVNSDNSAIKKIGETYIWDEEINKDTPASDYISKVINYFLAITAFIAFLSLAYGFSLVFIDKTEEAVKKWFKIVKIASIALIVIWISWLISIWFIWIYTHNVVK